MKMREFCLEPISSGGYKTKAYVLREGEKPWEDHIHCRQVNPALDEAIEKMVEALEYYAKHDSVIKEAYHSTEQKQITCVHTFINHEAIKALEAWREATK